MPNFSEAVMARHHTPINVPFRKRFNIDGEVVVKAPGSWIICPVNLSYVTGGVKKERGESQLNY